MMAFVRNLKQDLNEQQLLGDIQLSEDKDKRLLFLQRLSEQIEKNKLKYPIMSNFHKNFKEKLEKDIQHNISILFTLDNSYLDLSTCGTMEYPSSRILKYNDFATITKWLPTKHK